MTFTPLAVVTVAPSVIAWPSTAEIVSTSLSGSLSLASTSTITVSSAQVLAASSCGSGSPFERIRPASMSRSASPMDRLNTSVMPPARASLSLFRSSAASGLATVNSSPSGAVNMME